MPSVGGGRIVEAFDVLKQIAPGVGPSGVDPVMDALDFEGVEEALHGRIVEAIALAAHRGPVMPADCIALRYCARGILNAPIGMVDQAGSQAAAPRWPCVRAASGSSVRK